MSEEDVEIHAIITGYVQGVGFRYTTERVAATLGISGTVKNLPDGSVELYAQGPKLTLDRLLEDLRSSVGGVDGISVEVSEANHRFDGFRILF